MTPCMRIAAVLAGAMLSAALSGTTASAARWTLNGAETETAFADMIALDDKGMLSFGNSTPYQVYMQYVTDYYDRESESGIERIYYDNCCLYTVSPRQDVLQFVLRGDIPDAEQQMLDILETYYPGIGGSFTERHPNANASLTAQFYVLNDGTSTGPHAYELQDLSDQAGSDARADSIMRELAKTGILSEFYTWGQTACCSEWVGFGEYAEDFDRAAAEAYLAAKHPAYTVAEETHTAEFSEETLTWHSYKIVPDRALTFAEQFALAADLYEATGIRPAIWTNDEIQTLYGENALAVPGDLNLDCDINIADAVLLARFAAEDAELSLTAAGSGNADFDGDGLVTARDTAALLRSLADIA